MTVNKEFLATLAQKLLNIRTLKITRENQGETIISQ